MLTGEITSGVNGFDCASVQIGASRRSLNRRNQRANNKCQEHEAGSASAPPEGWQVHLEGGEARARRRGLRTATRTVQDSCSTIS